MFRALIGDLFESRAQTLVNTVNCVGVMGKGVAEQFKLRFPAMFEDYKSRADRKAVAARGAVPLSGSVRRADHQLSDQRSLALAITNH
jgi:O-acetyl-ADP-ribose deacetylase (regulator of RNase III)